MRPSLRFLALAVVGWAGFRAASLGMIPTGFFSIDKSEVKAPPPIVPTEFPQIEPIEPAAPIAPAAATLPAAIPASAPAAVPIQYVQGVVGVPVAIRRGVVPVYRLPAAAPRAPRVKSRRVGC